MKTKFIIFHLFFTVFCFCQSSSKYDLIDNKMNNITIDFTATTETLANYINANFKTDEDKIRAVFYWTASNISYDVKNMDLPNGNVSSEEKIITTLKTRKGVCIHYAEVFNSISNKVGLKTYIINGYTKKDGKINNLPHAWCASKIEGKWFLFDPTWGSGGVNEGVFNKKINNNWFKVEPNKMTLSHLSFDYLWQFLNKPITNDEFISGKIQTNKINRNFDFETEISKNNSSSKIDQLIESKNRIESNGYKPQIVMDYLSYVKKNITLFSLNQGIERMNAISAEYNQAVALLNDFVFYRNKKFKPTYSDEQIENMIVIPRGKLLKCQDDIYSIGPVGIENTSNLTNLKNLISIGIKNTEEHYQFVKEYLKKSEIGRKLMFSKISLSRK